MGTDLHDLDDAVLVGLCRRGDTAAWEALVTRYQRLVFSIPRRAGLDEDLAADVFQQVFATLVEQLGRLEHPERVAGWLATTARRESWRVSRLRRGLPATTISNEDGDLELPDRDPLPGEELERIEEHHRVRVAVGRLDEKCRNLLQALFFAPEPPAYAEVATRLGIPEGSIGPTRGRCLQKVRRLLETNGA